MERDSPFMLAQVYSSMALDNLATNNPDAQGWAVQSYILI